MNVAIWLLTGVLALPLAEIVTFALVAAWIGFGWAALAILTTSLAGAVMLRLGSGGRVARLRVVLETQRLAALQADSAGTIYLLAAILLLIPGFITDVIGILLLLPPARRLLGTLLGRAFGGSRTPRRADAVDLEAQEWRRVPDPALSQRKQRDADDRLDDR